MEYEAGLAFQSTELKTTVANRLPLRVRSCGFCPTAFEEHAIKATNVTWSKVLDLAIVAVQRALLSLTG
jgi:hypothetical protein